MRQVTGGCHCGAVRYTARGAHQHHTLCHCGDCRRHAGAPMVGWIAFPEDQVAIDGDPVTYASSPGAARRFCGRCGTGLFYTNADMLPGIVDIQAGTLDDPEAMPPDAHIQTAERIGWTRGLDTLPEFARFPSA